MKEKLKQMANKVKDYFKDKKITKKEGLYIAIFSGVCISLISGIVILKNVNANKENAQKKPEKEIALEIPKDKEVSGNTIENSERVEKDKDKNKETSKAVNAKPEVSFTKPVEGKLVKGHDDAIISEDGKRSDMFGGISISAKLGTDIKAAEAGVIEKVENNNVMFGTTVTIKHVNGMKTEYSNLDAKLNVKKGDKVTKGQNIGKIGKTAQSLSAALKCDFVHLKMYTSKDNKDVEIDPAKYFSYKK
ncbi:MAG: peptidoglycan DD-metalloendopeptidase family protein [Clostridium sp.]|uniref:peptidoglycan DD-metalloendopeptidase family protein n=1 Tax=Clostridium sp. TaxID=1506 RepID=UPI003F3A50B1